MARGFLPGAWHLFPTIVIRAHSLSLLVRRHHYHYHQPSIYLNTSQSPTRQTSDFPAQLQYIRAASRWRYRPVSLELQWTCATTCCWMDRWMYRYSVSPPIQPPLLKLTVWFLEDEWSQSKCWVPQHCCCHFNRHLQNPHYDITSCDPQVISFHNKCFLGFLC